jgi:endonuclease/exonuclease/phosphatase family metal-dependent hydrolase
MAKNVDNRSLLTTSPNEVKQDLAILSRHLDERIPAKMLDRNLLIATWNIREFGGLTRKWKSDPRKDEPKRDLHAILCIAEIISRFDIMAIQEVKNQVTALRNVLKALGPDWAVMLSDETKGDLGKHERIAFLFDTRRLILSGLACELVLSEKQLDEMAAGENKRRKQFARTPYAVGFRSRSTGRSFTLVAFHVLYGKRVSDRIPELKMIAQWLADWANDKNAWDQNLIVLGDFNIESKKSSTYEPFTSTGLRIPEELLSVSRTLKQTPDETLKYYDQIAWFHGDNDVPALSLKYSTAGNFDFSDCSMVSRELDEDDLSWYLSDHLPLWVEFVMED